MRKCQKSQDKNQSNGVRVQMQRWHVLTRVVGEAGSLGFF